MYSLTGSVYKKKNMTIEKSYKKGGGAQKAVTSFQQEITAKLPRLFKISKGVSRVLQK